MTPISSTVATPELAAGEFAFTDRDLQRIAVFMRAAAGIHLPPSKKPHVYSRLTRRLRALRIGSFAKYCDLIESADGADERGQALAALTTNVTHFFREKHHFDHLQSHVLPPLLDGARRGGKVRIWSAACSSGQEPYSIGLTILGLMPDAADFDVRILATDVDATMVRATAAGIYPERELEKMPRALRDRWFERVSGVGASGDNRYRVAAPLGRLVVARELNLMGDWPMKATYHAIFCRNVAIYFDAATQAQLWHRFVPRLADNGRLYIGHSERLSGAATDSFVAEGVTTYRLAKGLGR